MSEIVISSGHAKYVSGANSILVEVTEARRVVNKTAEYLKRIGTIVHTFHDDTSKTQNQNINTIVKYHNSKQRDLDVSVHFNAASKTDSPRGVEVLYATDNNRGLAEKVSKAIADVSGLKNRGAKKRTNLGFLNGTAENAILIEVAFVDSSADVDIYNNKFDGICRVIAETLTDKKLDVKVKVATSEKVVNFYTGGYSKDNLIKIHNFLTENNYWFNPTRADNSSLFFTIGGFTENGATYNNMKKFLDDNGYWYSIQG